MADFATITSLFPVVLTEVGGRNRVATFQGSDLPRNGGWLKLGGEQRGYTHWYPGSRFATTHILGPREVPIQLRGMFEDRRRQIRGHAVAQLLLLDSIRKAGQLVDLNYGPFGRRCRWVRAEFQTIELSRISYDIELEPVTAGGGTADKVRRAIKTIPVVGPLLDQAATIASILGAIPPSVGSDQVQGAILSTIEVLGALGSVETILDGLGTASAVDPDQALNALGYVSDAQGFNMAALTNTRNMNWNLGPLNGFDKVGTAQTVLSVRGDQQELQADMDSLSADVGRLANLATRNLVHITSDGETLQRIAQRFYGTATRWPEIQRANGITEVQVPAGTQLVIPDAPLQDLQVRD